MGSFNPPQNPWGRVKLHLWDKTRVKEEKCIPKQQQRGESLTCVPACIQGILGKQPNNGQHTCSPLRWDTRGIQSGDQRESCRVMAAAPTSPFLSFCLMSSWVFIMQLFTYSRGAGYSLLCPPNSPGSSTRQVLRECLQEEASLTSCTPGILRDLG